MTYDRERWRALVENGKIPRRLLAEVEPTQYDPDLEGPAIMHPEAAAAMTALLAEAPAGLHVLYSYRTFAKQVEKWEAYQAGGNLAAEPGTSNHGWATAVDLTGLGTVQRVWLSKNAGRFGYVFDVPSENWHAVYYGGFDPAKEDDVNLDKYIEGEKKFRDKYKAKAKDPGPAPKEMKDPYALAGWNAARFSANNPKT